MMWTMADPATTPGPTRPPTAQKASQPRIRFGFDSVVVRLGIIFVAGVAAALGALTLGLVWPGGPGRPVFSLIAPEDAAAMAAAVEEAPPGYRERLLRALSVDSIHVHVAPGFSSEASERADRLAPRLERRYGQYAAALRGRPFGVQTQFRADIRVLRSGGLGAAAPVRLLVGLRTGEVLVIARTQPPAVARLFQRSALIGAAALLILLGVLFAAVHQTARPVTALAAGARRFAEDLAAPDLPERGPRELKDLASAFNHMKATIRGLMDERTRMLAAIAHDLRTYLTRLRLRVEEIDDPVERSRAVADVEEASALLDDTLTFARHVAKAEAGTTPHAEVLEEFARLDEVRRDLDQPVTVTPPAEPMVVLCAPLALRRMLTNLTDNAVRYGRGVHVSAAREGPTAVIAIEDSGPGVPAEALARLTEPFERLEPSRGRGTGGAGLGLAIVKGLAESQGGELILANRPEGGLRAELRLRLA